MCSISVMRLVPTVGLAVMAMLVPDLAPAQTATTPPTNWSATSPAAARWFSHVETLARDEMRGRETGSPEHRQAADYVAAQFKAAGLAPGTRAGYLQPVSFVSRRLLEEQSSLALVKDGATVPVTLGEQATFGMRIDPAPTVEAPLVFAGYGLQVPETGIDDFAGLDVKGKVVVYRGGQSGRRAWRRSARTTSRRGCARRPCAGSAPSA